MKSKKKPYKETIQRTYPKAKIENNSILVKKRNEVNQCEN